MSGRACKERKMEVDEFVAELKKMQAELKQLYRRVESLECLRNPSAPRPYRAKPEPQSIQRLTERVEDLERNPPSPFFPYTPTKPEGAQPEEGPQSIDRIVERAADLNRTQPSPLGKRLAALMDAAPCAPPSNEQLVQSVSAAMARARRGKGEDAS
jgi:hypothetical protein